MQRVFVAIDMDKNLSYEANGRNADIGRRRVRCPSPALAIPRDP